MSACPSAAAQSTPTAAPSATRTPAAATPAAQQTAPRIITPPPIQAEEPLTGASSAAPSIFAGVNEFTPVHAELMAADADITIATTLADAASAVVQIRRCDAFGCATPVGSSTPAG